MTPATAISHSADIPPLYSKVVGNGLVDFSGRSPASNFSHHFIRQRGIVVSLALFAAMSSHVQIIVQRRSPIKILAAVISGIAILVARLHSLWSRSYEGFQNKMVNVAKVAAAKVHNCPSIVPANTGFNVRMFQLTPFV